VSAGVEDGDGQRRAAGFAAFLERGFDDRERVFQAVLGIVGIIRRNVCRADL